MAPSESPFVLCKIRQSVSLLPCHIGETRVGIDQEMTSLLMKYSEKLQGVILSLSNVKLQQPFGHIMNEQPYIHCKVIADALVFQPKEGMTLRGVVNKIGSNHIGMLFAGVFNGSVAASELPKGYVHNYAADCWNGPDGSSISMNETVDVTVVRIHVAGGMISIDATMRTASAKNLGKDKKPKRKSMETTSPSASAVVAAVDVSTKKKSKKDKKQIATDEHAVVVVTTTMATKKRKTSKAPVEEPPVEAAEETTPKKKKSKKSTKE